MALEVTLMAIVAAVIVWVVQVENGGLLNVFFMKVPNSIEGVTYYDITSKVDYNYFIDMLLLKSLSLPILRSLPEAIGGGEVGVANANRHPNREPVIFWLTVALFVLALFLIIAIQVINCCCCCGKGKKVCTSPLSLKSSKYITDFNAIKQ